MSRHRTTLRLVPTLLLVACTESAPSSAPPLDASGEDATKPVDGGPDTVTLGARDGQGPVDTAYASQKADAQDPEVYSAVDSPDVSMLAEAGGPPDVSWFDASSPMPACTWPAPIDAGPGACWVGRVHLECSYPSGATCDDGKTYTGSGGVRMLCVSDDPTGCPGCHPISGTATCQSLCAPNQYVMACGGPPRLALDGGGIDRGYYQEPADVCTLATPTPSGMGYWCCPCE